MGDFADFDVEFEQNLEEVKAWDGESAPLADPGTYRMRIENVESDSGPKGAYAKLTYVIEAAYDADGNEVATTFVDSKVWQNYSFSPKALGRVKQLMVACGAQLDKFRASEIKDAVIIADVVHNVGAAKIDEAGNALPPRTFANVQNERAYEVPKAAASNKKAETKTETKAPPPAKPATNGAARRA